MTQPVRSGLSGPTGTLKKAVTTLAIAPQTESLTRTGRMAYNLMIYHAQRMVPDQESGYSAPLSDIIKGYGATTRDSNRVRGYIEQMCTTLVRWFPLSRSDDEVQAQIVGLEPPLPTTTTDDGRVFTLLSEARFTRRGGEQWVTWYFPPSIREMIISPTRWAQIDLQEMTLLSHYASVVLYEICSRYRDVPGGLTNRAETAFWSTVLRPDPETKPREWRKFKNETLKPALAEINQKTSLEISLIEEKRGRSVASVQFQVRVNTPVRAVDRVDLSLVEQAEQLNIKERDLDALVDDYGEGEVRRALGAIEGRLRAQPTVPIKHPVAYLRKSLRNGAFDSLFDHVQQQHEREPPSRVTTTTEPQPEAPQEGSWLARRRTEINDALDDLPQGEIERYALVARQYLSSKGLLSTAMQRRFDQKQYRAPMVWEYIRQAFAEDRYGPEWRVAPVLAAESVP